MSQQRNQEAFRAVELAQKRLQASLQKFANSERYRRGWERSKEFRSDASKAIQYLDLAAEALDPQSTAASVRSESWLSRSLQGLARYLTHGATEEMYDGEEAEALVELSRNGQGFSGDCQVMELPDLVGMLRAQQKTGVLTLQCPDEVVHLHFQFGELVHAISQSCPPELRLGEILVQMSCISRERLDSLLFCHGSSPKLLGDILVDGGLVHPTHLQQALVYQIQRLFDRLFEFKEETSFCFDPGLPPVPTNRARLNVLQLLLDSARISDETFAEQERAARAAEEAAAAAAAGKSVETGEVAESAESGGATSEADVVEEEADEDSAPEVEESIESEITDSESDSEADADEVDGDDVEAKTGDETEAPADGEAESHDEESGDEEPGDDEPGDDEYRLAG